MMERSVEASPCPRARITGVVYLSYFLTAVCGEFLLKGLVVHGDAAATANNILAHQPLFRLGLATGLIATACYVAVTALFYGLFKAVNRTGRQHMLRIFRSLLPPDRLPHLQVGLPTPNSGRVDGVCRFGLADLSVAAARKLSVPLYCCPRLPRGTIADAMAARDGRERSTMEGTGQRREGTPMKAAVYTRYGPPDVVQITDAGKPSPNDNKP